MLRGLKFELVINRIKCIPLGKLTCIMCLILQSFQNCCPNISFCLFELPKFVRFTIIISSYTVGEGKYSFPSRSNKFLRWQYCDVFFYVMYDVPWWCIWNRVERNTAPSYFSRLPILGEASKHGSFYTLAQILLFPMKWLILSRRIS